MLLVVHCLFDLCIDKCLGLIIDEPYYFLSEVLSHDSQFAGDCLKQVLDQYNDDGLTDIFLWMDNVSLI